jgi:hypothetical protein
MQTILQSKAQDVYSSQIRKLKTIINHTKIAIHTVQSFNILPFPYDFISPVCCAEISTFKANSKQAYFTSEIAGAFDSRCGRTTLNTKEASQRSTPVWNEGDVHGTCAVHKGCYRCTNWCTIYPIIPLWCTLVHTISFCYWCTKKFGFSQRTSVADYVIYIFF